MMRDQRFLVEVKDRHGKWVQYCPARPWHILWLAPMVFGLCFISKMLADVTLVEMGYVAAARSTPFTAALWGMLGTIYGWFVRCGLSS